MKSLECGIINNWASSFLGYNWGWKIWGLVERTGHAIRLGPNFLVERQIHKFRSCISIWRDGRWDNFSLCDKSTEPLPLSTKKKEKQKEKQKERGKKNHLSHLKKNKKSVTSKKFLQQNLDGKLLLLTVFNFEPTIEIIFLSNNNNQ